MNENNQATETSNISTAALLAVFSIVLFLNTLKNDFTYDDLKVVQWNPFLIGDAGLVELLNESRVVRTLTLMLDHRLFGMNPQGYHFQNVLWHGLTSVLLYFFVLRLSGDRTVSTLSALIFASHPIHVEAVANISNRKDIISLAFSVASFLFYLKSYECRGNRRSLTIALALLSISLAMLSKQSAVVLPLMIYAYELYFIPQGNKRLINDNMRWLWKAWFPFILYGLYYLWTALSGFSKLNIIFNPAELLFTTMRMILFYNNMLLWPVNMSADHVFLLSDSFTEAKVQVSLIVWLMLIWAVIKLFRKEPLISFGLLWYIVTLLPVLFLPGTGYFAAERYLYMPSVGFVLIFAIAIGRLIKSRYRASVILFSIIIILHSANTLHRNAIWENNVTLWLDALKKDPMSIRAVLTKASLYHYNGEPEKAIPYYQRAVEILPGEPGTLNNLGSIYTGLGRHDDAVRLYKMALDPGRNKILDLSNYKLINGLNEVSLRECRDRLKSDPGNAEVYFQLGFLYVKTGENEKALRAFEDFLDSWKGDRRYSEIALDEIKRLKRRSNNL